ncbi:MAG: T9SS type A sorting domain-containing protein [Ignavibacteria bacterium]|nr:T9SS type A sorting domain-containing protein [Ignavibacteria bacterium]
MNLKFTIWFLFLASFVFCGTKGTNDWFGLSRNYKLSITVQSGGTTFYNKPVEQSINFTSFLIGEGETSAFSLKSLKLVEVDAEENLVDSVITFQFDVDDNYDSLTNAVGKLVFIMEGTTAVSSERYFHLYYDVVGKSYTAPIRPALVELADSTVVDEGQVSYQIEGQNAVYYYQKEGAAFSSILDNNGNDWVGYQSTGNLNLQYRGIPNLGVCGHPGFSGELGSESRIIYNGPARIKVRSVTSDSKWVFEWDFFPEFARMTLIEKDPAVNYWFLYEGTPGGSFSPNDFMFRNSNVSNYLDANWSGDLSNPEWVCFGDETLSRALYFIQHEGDNIIDSYKPHGVTEPELKMTIFGFGRNGSEAELTAAPAQFTIGISEANDYATVSGLVTSVLNDITVNIEDPLPVELTSFTASVEKNTVKLKWQTATEVNNYGFAVERSTVKGEWLKVGFVEGAGNSNSHKKYSFTDNLTLTSYSYSYRLKQIDLNGSFTYSNEVKVKAEIKPTEFALSQNYPNPFNPVTTIKYSIPNNGVETQHAASVQLKVFNLLGQEVATLVNKQQPAGSYEVKFDGSNLPSGIYIYKLTSGEYTAVKKFTLLK